MDLNENFKTKWEEIDNQIIDSCKTANESMIEDIEENIPSSEEIKALATAVRSEDEKKTKDLSTELLRRIRFVAQYVI